MSDDPDILPAAVALRPPREEEPDYRFTFANERTFLAWIRTALALLGAGGAVEQPRRGDVRVGR